MHLEVLKPVNDSEELNRSYVGYFCNSCFVSTLLNVIGNVSLKPFFSRCRLFPPMSICIANSCSARFRIVTGQTLSVEVHLLKRAKKNLIYFTDHLMNVATSQSLPHAYVMKKFIQIKPSDSNTI